MPIPTVSNESIDALRTRRREIRNDRETLQSNLDTLLDSVRNEKRDLRASESRAFERTVTEIRGLDAQGRDVDLRIDELESQRSLQNDEREVQRLVGGFTATPRPGDVYRPDDVNVSFFRDLRNARLGDFSAAERLNRNHQGEMERRAGDMTTTAGQGGQFAPPSWLVEDFIALARAGRVTADLCQKDTLPSGISSINLPKVASGATTAVQATQNSALSDTAMTTTSVSSGITTVGGKQIVSLQLLNQSGVPFDRVILQDLAADYAKMLDQQVLYGSNASGQLRGLVGVATNTAYTTASPALTSTTSANSFYNRVVGAAAGMATTRFLPANAVVMHPNRWAWCLEALDSQSRPLITADGPTFNAAAISTESVAEGSVGTLAKIPVYIDPNISLTANSATNQDEVYVLRREDLYLWESQLLLESFEATYADNASVLFRCLAFSAFIPDRYSASVASIRGTGLVAPSL